MADIITPNRLDYPQEWEAGISPIKFGNALEKQGRIPYEADLKRRKDDIEKAKIRQAGQKQIDKDSDDFVKPFSEKITSPIQFQDKFNSLRSDLYKKFADISSRNPNALYLATGNYTDSDGRTIPLNSQNLSDRDELLNIRSTIFNARDSAKSLLNVQDQAYKLDLAKGGTKFSKNFEDFQNGISILNEKGKLDLNNLNTDNLLSSLQKGVDADELAEQKFKEALSSARDVEQSWQDPKTGNIVSRRVKAIPKETQDAVLDTFSKSISRNFNLNNTADKAIYLSKIDALRKELANYQVDRSDIKQPNAASQEKIENRPSDLNTTESPVYGIDNVDGKEVEKEVLQFGYRSIQPNLSSKDNKLFALPAGPVISYIKGNLIPSSAAKNIVPTRFSWGGINENQKPIAFKSNEKPTFIRPIVFANVDYVDPDLKIKIIQKLKEKGQHDLVKNVEDTDLSNKDSLDKLRNSLSQFTDIQDLLQPSNINNRTSSDKVIYQGDSNVFETLKTRWYPNAKSSYDMRKEADIRAARAAGIIKDEQAVEWLKDLENKKDSAKTPPPPPPKTSTPTTPTTPEMKTFGKEQVQAMFKEEETKK